MHTLLHPLYFSRFVWDVAAALRCVDVDALTSKLLSAFRAWYESHCLIVACVAVGDPEITPV